MFVLKLNSMKLVWSLFC